MEGHGQKGGGREKADRAKENRRVKDSVFVDLFGRDRDFRRNFISLYNALNGTGLSAEAAEVSPEMIENAVYMTYANDIAMLVNGRIVVLIEHQSTINRNMPLRLLDYVARIYEKLVSGREKFKRQRVEIPAPEFYVLYNGEDELPAESEMRLSEAFKYPGGKRPAEVPLELVVKVYNINVGKGDRLLEKCEPLRQYSEFIALVRDAGKKQIKEPLTWAVKEAIRQGILADYLERKATEVINMLNMEYDYDLDLATRWEEGRESGLDEGLKKGHESTLAESIRSLMVTLGLPQEKAMDALQIPSGEREKYAAMLRS